MSQRLPKLNSLRSQLMLLVGLAVAPSLLLTAYNGWKEREQAIMIAEENLQRLTKLASVNEAESIRNARQLLVDLSGIPGLLGPDEECSQLMTTIQRKNPGYLNLGLIQMNGDVTCSAVPASRPVNLADRPHFKTAIEERRFVAGDYIFGRVIRKHTINLTYPVTQDDGTVVAVVFAALDLSQLDSFSENISLPPGSLLVTTDRHGNILSRRPDPDQRIGTKVEQNLWEAMSNPDHPPALVKGSDGVMRVHAFARVGGPELSNYLITIGIPSNTIIEAAQRDQLMALALLAVITVLALGATWVVGHIVIVSRVQKLVTTAGRIASGDLDARTGLRYGREEIGYLAHALDDMAHALQCKKIERDRAEEELRAADRRKDEFLAMLAHELRNPLAPIRTGTELLRIASADQSKVCQISEIIGRQVEHMTGLVDDLLDVSRVTRGLVNLSKEPLDLSTVIHGAVEQSRAVIDERGHRLTLELPAQSAWVFGDRMRLTQVVTNLLNNAAKYTPEGGAIRVWLRENRSEWRLGVKDNGLGITPELLPHVFELFTQAERTPDRSQGGLGLGLALVRSMVVLHGGEVIASSAGSGRGSEFIIHLPRLREVPPMRTVPADGTDSAAMSPSLATPMRLLVIDDNADATTTIAALLQTLGHDVSTAYNGHTALIRAAQKAPQVVLLDIGLPDMDGYELARRLRKLPQMADATLIALTGYGHPEDLQRSKAVGIDHHLVKPVDPVVLTKLLAEVGRAVMA